MKIINQVYESKDYDMFKFMRDNREITENIKLQEEIKANGVLMPVLVNEKYEVIDGQHRVEIARKLGLSVPFIIRNGAGKKEVISINTTSKQWSLMDYVRSYRDEGVEEYERFYKLTQKYDVLPGVLCSLSFNTTDGHKPAQKVRDKQLEFVHYDFLVEFLGFYQELLDKTTLENTRGLAASLYIVYRLEKFDPNRIFDKSGLITDKLRGISQQGTTTRVVLECYNQRLRVGSENEIKYHANARGAIEFFEKIKPELKGLQGSSEVIYRL